LLVTDYNMPRMDGLELITYVRERSSQRFLPIIMVTTETAPPKIQPVEQLGVAAVCEKSFEPEAVRKVIDRLVKMP
jgi:two-component system chemotaxis response regulator CheY